MHEGKIGVLLNQIITKIYVGKGESALYFVTRCDEIYEVTTDAECCSETWFADIVGVQALVGANILGIEIKELDSPIDNRSRQNKDEVYGFTFKTYKGYCDFVYRNSSNGYYGGGIDDVRKIEALPADITEITNDWSA